MSATQPELEKEGTGENNSEEQLSYQCPYCDEEYSHEYLARVHITRSEDAAHLNKNGLMPEAEIDVVNEDGEVVDTISRKRADNINLESLSLDDISDEYNDRHKAIILTGAYYPYIPSEGKGEEEKKTYRDLTDKAEDIMKDHGLEPLSYSTVRRVTREFYRPQEVKAEKEEKEAKADEEETEELLRDLKPKQQAIVIASLAHPDEKKSKIADRGDAANSYPNQVYDRADDIIDRLDDKMESGASVEEAVMSELQAEDVEKLTGKDFNLGVDLKSELTDEEVEEVFDMGVGEQRQAMSASPYETGAADTTSEDEEPEETWGTPETETEADATAGLDEVEEPVQEIQPTDEVTEEAEAESEVDAEDEPEVEAESEAEVATEPESEGDVGEEIEEVAEEISEGAIPKEKVQDLHEKVAFFVDITESEMETEAQSRQYAFAERVERELDELLEAY